MLKNHIKFCQKFLIFFHTNISTEQLGWRNNEAKSLNRILGTKNTILTLEKQKWNKMINSLKLEKDEKEKVSLLKM